MNTKLPLLALLLGSALGATAQKKAQTVPVCTDFVHSLIFN
jgi:hypothetical protein